MYSKCHMSHADGGGNWGLIQAMCTSEVYLPSLTLPFQQNICKKLIFVISLSWLFSFEELFNCFIVSFCNFLSLGFFCLLCQGDLKSMLDDQNVIWLLQWILRLCIGNIAVVYHSKVTITIFVELVLFNFVDA